MSPEVVNLKEALVMRRMYRARIERESYAATMLSPERLDSEIISIEAPNVSTALFLASLKTVEA